MVFSCLLLVQVPMLMQMPSATVALHRQMPMLLHSPRAALRPQLLMPVHPAGATLRLPVLMPLHSARVAMAAALQVSAVCTCSLDIFWCTNSGLVGSHQCPHHLTECHDDSRAVTVDGH
jgi:hypothetical protein